MKRDQQQRQHRPPLTEVSIASDGGVPVGGAAVAGGSANGLRELMLDQSELERQLQQFTSSVLSQSPYPATPSASTTAARLLPAVLQLKKELLESQQGVFLLREENKALVAERERAAAEAERHAKELHKKARELDEALTAELEKARRNAEASEAESERLRAKLEEADEENALKLQSLRDEHAAKESELEEELKSRQAEIDRLNIELRKSESRLQQRQEEVKGRATGLEKDVDRLEKQLAVANNKLNAVRGEKLALRKQLASQQERLQQQEQTEVRQSISTADASCQTTEGGAEYRAAFEGSPAGVDTIADRLGRIRDAAERAALLQEYRREVSRLKADHEAEILSLETEHDESLQKVVAKAKNEVNSKTKEYKHRLSASYESKLAALEKKHREELERVSDISQESDEIAFLCYA